MTISLQDFVLQLASSFFHERGMEPAIDVRGGTLQVDKPKDMSDDQFGVIMSEMAEHIRVRTERYCNGKP